jgi:hypothetical protein
MLHLKCFCALEIGGRWGTVCVGEQGQGRGGRDFYSVLFRYAGRDSVLGGRFYEGERRPDASRAPDVRALGASKPNSDSCL